MLISIKFTPKTSHSCPKNWYFPRISRCQPNKNVSTKDQTKKNICHRLVVASKDVIFRNQGYILLMDLDICQPTLGWYIYRFCNGLRAACYPPVNEDGNEISPCSERKRTFKWSIFHCHFSLQEGSIFIPTKQGP